jgi:hypothetical protein
VGWVFGGCMGSCVRLVASTLQFACDSQAAVSTLRPAVGCASPPAAFQPSTRAAADASGLARLLEI